MVLFGMQRSLEETTKFADAWLLGWLAVIVHSTFYPTILSPQKGSNAAGRSGGDYKVPSEVRSGVPRPQTRLGRPIF